MSNSADVRSSETNALPQQSPAQKDCILVLAPEAATFQGLTQAMQQRLPGFRVILAAAMGDTSVDGVCLVLLHHKAGTPLGEALRNCRQLYADVPTGLVTDDARTDMAECELAFANRLVQGLLPLELKLEVWLAALSLLISGGEYYPPFLSGNMATPYRERGTVPQNEPRPATADAAEAGRGDLTSRELQILELVSQGYQNKLIANRIGLSEHTVKVHVHNLITKLKVTNRTQAAAAFRTGVGQASRMPARDWRAAR